LSSQALNSIDRETNLRLPSRADKILTYDLSRTFGNLEIGGNVLARSNSFDEDWKGNRTEVSGFVTLDLRSAYHFNNNWMLSAKLNNLLDKNYQTVNTYNTADRNFFVSVHYNN
jgi:vitamin B12 transporter